MSLRKIGFFILSFVLVFSSCKKDDGIDAPTPINLEDKQKTDNDSIISYLNTHYYNSGEFDSNNTNVNNLMVTEIELGGDVPSGNSLLMTDVETKSFKLGDLTYEYYILKVNQGGGINSPKFSDDVLISYEGFRVLDDFVFDSRLNPNPSILDLTNTIEGWKLIIPEFSASSGIVDNGDGTTTFTNSGLGMMFIPSALGYLFSNNSLQLQPLVFKFEVIKSFEKDHDNDGIPSYLEELTGDQSFSFISFSSDEDDDTDGDGRTDFNDTDDDGDGILTKNEIIITTENRASVEELKMITLETNQVLLNEITEEENGTFTGTIITFTDTDSDSIPDYLDAE